MSAAWWQLTESQVWAANGHRGGTAISRNHAWSDDFIVVYTLYSTLLPSDNKINSSKAPLRHRYVNMRSTPSSYLVHRRQIISPNRWKVQQIGAVPSVYDDRPAVIARAIVCGRLQRQRPGWGDWTPRDVRRHNRMLSVSDASNFVTAFWTATYYPPRIRAT